METQNTQAKSWSWGGFMFDPLVLIATKNYTYLLLYLLYFVPVLNFIAVVGIKIYVGLTAHKLIANSEAFSNPEEARGFIKGIDHAGQIMFYVALIGLAIGLLGALTAGFGVMGMFFHGWKMF